MQGVPSRSGLPAAVGTLDLVLCSSARRTRETLELIAAEFTVSWPAVSQHLRVLKEAGLVTERREGTRRLYRARPEGLTDVRAFLDSFWDDKLERLKREVERG